MTNSLAEHARSGATTNNPTRKVNPYEQKTSPRKVKIDTLTSSRIQTMACLHEDYTEALLIGRSLATARWYASTSI